MMNVFQEYPILHIEITVFLAAVLCDILLLIRKHRLENKILHPHIMINERIVILKREHYIVETEEIREEYEESTIQDLVDLLGKENVSLTVFNGKVQKYYPIDKLNTIEINW